MEQTQVIKSVLTLAHQLIKEVHRDAAKAYLDLYARSLPSELLHGTTARSLLDFMMERFGFVEEGFSDQVKVRIGPPSPVFSQPGHAVAAVETRLPDCTFIVRTLKSFFRNRSSQILLAVNPVFGVSSHNGLVSSVDPEAKQGMRISHIYMHVSHLPESQWEEISRELEERLKTLIRVNRDYPTCSERLAAVRQRLAGLPPLPAEREEERAEALELAAWLADNNFIFMGYAYHPAEPQGSAPRDALGLLALESQAGTRQPISELAVRRAGRPEVYSFYRTDCLSVVKSEAQLRYAGFHELDPSGKTLGEHVFVGLLSSNALSEPNKRIPIVSKRMKQVIDSMHLLPGTYDFKKVFGILNSMPNEDMFYSTLDEIRLVARFIRDAEASDNTRVLIRRRHGSTRISTICVLPRARFSEALKARVSRTIREFLEVPHLREFACESDDEGPIRLHFYVSRYRAGVTEADLQELRSRVALQLATWEERVQRLLDQKYQRPAGEATASKYLAVAALSGAEMWARYGAAFPESYRQSQSPELALADIDLMEKLSTESEVQCALAVEPDPAPARTSLRILSRANLILNDVVPVLERMGLRSVGRLSERFAPAGAEPIHFTSFEVTAPGGQAVQDPAALERLSEILQKVLSRRLGNDRLLGLGALAGLAWREIDLLITYRNHLLQIFGGYTALSVDEALLHHHECARLAVEYFEARFSTARRETPKERAERLLPEIERRYLERVDQVSLIVEDTVLRLLFSLVKNTLRTNYFAPGRSAVISVKVDSRNVDRMPRPCPLYEIYVHGPGVEGIHLRGGKVARGGIRHSDRPDDFRTEVLGLMRTQMTKNAVIVPVGSKGGFFTREVFSRREDMEAEGKRQYQHFIRGLLDLTDNLQGDAVVPPPGVLRYDADDPYLVVAADKGTAKLSDTANALSQEYRFWLDDAFASGGSMGYDHKVLGITARGAWVNVERHFRERGVILASQSVRVVGVGDMSGDVFGNGMLRNDKMKMVAAFDHRHIFLDPDPDPGRSFAERKRLFDLPRSSWKDYASGLLSSGGAVHDRAAKAITLSPEAQKLLGLGPAPISGPELVKKILTLDVDLLWFGGIGTYVKASGESHAEVGDKVNDSVRVNAAELSAKVIGEGANLAMTHKARTEFWLAGGACNTDALDNSAGVDTSDHEVNLKILFGRLMQKGILASREARNAFQKEIEDEVCQAVLLDNYLQGALVTMETLRSRREAESFLVLLASLEERGLDRVAEAIPPDEQLREWLSAGRGLPRNLLCVIAAHAKNDLFDKVLASKIPDLPFFAPYLESYFPKKVVERYREHLPSHRLRREIVATVVTNALVNQAGMTLLGDLSRESAAPLEELVIRYFVCDELADGARLRAAIHGLDNRVPAQDQYRSLLVLEEALRGLVRWWSWNDAAWKLPTEEVGRTKPDFERAAAALFECCESHPEAAREEELVRVGFPKELARRISRLPLLRHAFLVLAAARETSRPVQEVAGLYHGVGRALHLETAEAILESQPPANAWEKRFQGILERETAGLRSRFIARAAAAGGLEAFTAPRAARIERLGEALQRVKTAGRGGQVPLFIILDDFRGLLAD